MKCKNCGAELQTNSKFCGICGASVSMDTDAFANSDAKPASKLNRKSKKSKWILAGLSVLLLAGGIGGGSMIVNASRISEYQETVSLANRYYTQLDYERAEELYLRSIEIQPKEKEPYIQLVEIYVQTEQPEKVQSIVEKAQEKLPVQEAEEVKQIAEEAAKEAEKQKLEEQKVAELQKPAYNAYAEILQRMLDGYDPHGSGEKLFVDSSMSKPLLQYSVKDMDGDGIDELFVKYDGTGYGWSQAPLMAYGLIYTYDPDLSAATFKYRSGDIHFTPMSNGYLKTLGRPSVKGYFSNYTWEFLNVLKFDEKTGEYKTFAYTDEFDRDVMEKYYDTNINYVKEGDHRPLSFPGEYDDDNDGFLYSVTFVDSTEAPLYVDKDELEDVIAAHTDNAEEIDLVYEDVTPEVISKLKG